MTQKLDDEVLETIDQSAGVLPEKVSEGEIPAVLLFMRRVGVAIFPDNRGADFLVSQVGWRVVGGSLGLLLDWVSTGRLSREHLSLQGLVDLMSCQEELAEAITSVVALPEPERVGLHECRDLFNATAVMFSDAGDVGLLLGEVVAQVRARVGLEPGEGREALCELLVADVRSWQHLARGGI